MNNLSGTYCFSRKSYPYLKHVIFSYSLLHIQYGKPSIQSGSFAPSGMSQSSAKMYESLSPAIWEKSLLRPPISFFTSQREEK